MKRTATWKKSLMWLMVAGVIAAGGLFLPSCASSQRGKYAQMNDSFISITEILVEAKNTGLITPEEWKETIVPSLKLASDLLDQYDAATKAGDDGVRKTVLERFGDVMRILRPFVIRATENN